MPLTPIPADLIHRPEEVERDADRFDHLCQLVEEIAFPIVRDGLGRETASTGAEVLTEEAKHALQAVIEDAAIFEDLDEKEVFKQVQKTLNDKIPPPDEEECRQHAREFSQVLMSAWLETLRSAELEKKVVKLSDYLLPHAPSHGMTWLMEQFGAAKPKLPEMIVDAIAWFAVSEDDAAIVMKTLHDTLFAEWRLVDLPFDLALVGAPKKTVMVLRRPLWDRLGQIVNRAIEDLETNKGIAVGQQAVIESSEPTEMLTSPSAQIAVEVLSESLPSAQYECLAVVASPSFEEESIEDRVQHAVSTW